MAVTTKKDVPKESRSDILGDDRTTVKRIVEIGGGSVVLVAVQAGYGWTATVVSHAHLGRLEFQALFPKGALDAAEEFARKRLAENGARRQSGAPARRRP